MQMMLRLRVWPIAMVLLASMGRSFASAQVPAEANQCIRCHASLQDSRHVTPVTAFQEDVHRQRGFTCVDCHGGDAAATDKTHAKTPAAGYRGVPRGAAQIAVCARCHSDAELMRRFAPQQRVDQAAEYAVSAHGKRLSAGDARVATCASCHGAHGIRAVADATSPVFPTNVAMTCAVCHANGPLMARSDKSSIPTTQRADYEKSVHFAALMRRNDLSAPTCNDCHGNHGAAPPGVGAVANVCGACHAVFATRLATSVHAQILEKGCVDCHGNHAVQQPSDEMLGTSDKAICSTCHGETDDAGATAGKMRSLIDQLKAAIDRNASIVERLRIAGMGMSEQELAINEARNRLVRARTEVHTFSLNAVEPVAGEGLKILERVERAAEAAQAELRFRRRGLAVALGAILLVVGALTLKIRQLDRRSRH